MQTGAEPDSKDPARSQDRSSPDRQAAITVGQLKLPGKARGALSKAWVAMGKEKLADAARYVEKALTLCPKSAEALTFRAALKAQDINTRQEAKADAEKAVEYDPNLGGAYVILGSIYSSLGQFDDAVRTLDRGIALLPTQWAGYYEMSIALLGKQDFVGGLRQAEKASRLEGKNYPPLHLVKAYAYMGLKNRSAAVTELNAFQRLDPDNPLLTQAKKTFNNMLPAEPDSQVDLRP
jgi:tetratricopeptide (TPR) repeat protein